MPPALARSENASGSRSRRTLGYCSCLLSTYSRCKSPAVSQARIRLRERHRHVTHSVRFRAESAHKPAATPPPRVAGLPRLLSPDGSAHAPFPTRPLSALRQLLAPTSPVIFERIFSVPMRWKLHEEARSQQARDVATTAAQSTELVRSKAMW